MATSTGNVPDWACWEPKKWHALKLRMPVETVNQTWCGLDVPMMRARILLAREATDIMTAWRCAACLRAMSGATFYAGEGRS